MPSLTANIFNIQRFSTEDGPGIRTTVFLKGCPLRCLWCANPESQSSSQQLAYRDSLCINCGSCVNVCSAGAMDLDQNNKGIKINRTNCTQCGSCITACTTGALRFYGQKKTVDEVFNEINKDLGYYTMSKGGVTVSGGEPLLQADFVAELFRRCLKLGIHTTLDTSGYFSTSALYKVLDLVNLVLFDIKTLDRHRHRQLTGKFNDVILRNVRLIAQKGVPMIIRIPLIPSINDSEENLIETARFISHLDKSLHVDLLPYHCYGIRKYEMLDMDYLLTNVKPPDEKHMHWCREIFKSHGLECEIH